MGGSLPAAVGWGGVGALLLWASLACAQQPATIEVLLLNGNDGTALRVGNNGKAGAPLTLTVFADCGPGRICSFPGGAYSWPVDANGRFTLPLIDHLAALRVSVPTSYFHLCHAIEASDGSSTQQPSFRVADILRAGVVAPNDCNKKLHLQPHPGQLIFFMRPLSMWESLTRPPQM